MIPLIALGIMVGAVLLIAVGFTCVALRYNTRNNRKALLRQSLEAHWTPRLLPLLAGGDPAPLLAAVIPSERLFFVDFLFRYAIRLKGEERDILSGAAAPFLPELVTRLDVGGDANAEQRARAVRTLGTLGGSHHLPVLVAALDDPAPLVVMTAARALALRGYAALVELLLERSERFREWHPRFFASRVATDGLAELNDLGAASVATAVLPGTDDRDLQCACLRLLERVGKAADAAAVRPLIHSADPMVRQSAIAAIGTLGDLKDLPALRDALTEPDLWLALNAARALRKLGDEAWLSRLARTEESMSLIAAQVLREDPT
ncbi:MAG: HEAT repeat domain-containing protein [Gemmatimonadota bacterium]